MTAAELREEVGLILDGYANNPSNRNKYRYQMLALFDECGDQRARAIADWATGGDTGASSKALLRHMVGLNSNDQAAAPYDASDRGRCIRLLNRFPEWWDRLDEMAAYEERPTGIVFLIDAAGIRPTTNGWIEQIPLIRSEAAALKEKS